MLSAAHVCDQSFLVKVATECYFLFGFSVPASFVSASCHVVGHVIVAATGSEDIKSGFFFF